MHCGAGCLVDRGPIAGVLDVQRLEVVHGPGHQITCRKIVTWVTWCGLKKMCFIKCLEKLNWVIFYLNLAPFITNWKFLEHAATFPTFWKFVTGIKFRIMLHLQKTEVNEAKLHYTVFVLFSIEYTLERISRLSHSVFNVLHTAPSSFWSSHYNKATHINALSTNSFSAPLFWHESTRSTTVMKWRCTPSIAHPLIHRTFSHAHVPTQSLLSGKLLPWN